MCSGYTDKRTMFECVDSSPDVVPVEATVMLLVLLCSTTMRQVVMDY